MYNFILLQLFVKHLFEKKGETALRDGNLCSKTREAFVETLAYSNKGLFSIAFAERDHSLFFLIPQFVVDALEALAESEHINELIQCGISFSTHLEIPTNRENDLKREYCTM